MQNVKTEYDLLSCYLLYFVWLKFQRSRDVLIY